MSSFDRPGIESMRLHDSWRIKTVNQNDQAPVEAKRGFGFARDSELVARRNQRVREIEDEQRQGFAPATMRAIDVLPSARLRMQSSTPLARSIEPAPVPLDRRVLIRLGGSAAATVAGLILIAAIWPDGEAPAGSLAEAEIAPPPVTAPAALLPATSLLEPRLERTPAPDPAVVAVPAVEPAAQPDITVAAADHEGRAVQHAAAPHLQSPPTPLSVTDYARPPTAARGTSAPRRPSSVQPDAVDARRAAVLPVTEAPPSRQPALEPAASAPAERGPEAAFAALLSSGTERPASPGRVLLTVLPEARPPVPQELASVEIAPFLAHRPPVLKPLALAAKADAPLPSFKPADDLRSDTIAARNTRPVSPIVRFWHFLNGTGG